MGLIGPVLRSSAPDNGLPPKNLGLTPLTAQEEAAQRWDEGDNDLTFRMFGNNFE